MLEFHFEEGLSLSVMGEKKNVIWIPSTKNGVCTWDEDTCCC